MSAVTDDQIIAMFGRSELFTAKGQVTGSNLLEILTEVESTHRTNVAEIDYLYRYMRGLQPILNREKEVRPEICNKIVENHALEIVSFKTGYEFGEPIQYVRRGEREGTAEKIDKLNLYMNSINKHKADKQLAEWAHIGGYGFRLTLPNQKKGDVPIESYVIDPRTAGIIKSNGFRRQPLLGFIEVTEEDGSLVKFCYTETMYYEVVNNASIRVAQPHTIGFIPLTEYTANSSRLGAFEVVLGMLDGLNLMTSNRLDGIEQFVQSFMKFIDCDITADDFENLRAMGAIKIKSGGDINRQAIVDIITSELNQQQAQIAKDDLYQMVLTICGMPDRQGSNRTTGDTGAAVILRDGWGVAEAKARETELMFKASEREFLKIVLRIGNELDNLGLEINDIDVKFTRNKTDNLLVKTQGMQNLLEAGVAPRISIATTGLFSDPEQVFQESEPYLKKWEFKEATVTPANNKPNNPEGGIE